MIEKQKAIDALEAYRGNSKGLYASTVAGCIQVIRDLPEDDGWAYIKDISLPEGEPFPVTKEVSHQGDGLWLTLHRPCLRPLQEPPKEEK